MCWAQRQPVPSVIDTVLEVRDDVSGIDHALDGEAARRTAGAVPFEHGVGELLLSRADLGRSGRLVGVGW